jgi:hypothetical protein
METVTPLTREETALRGIRRSAEAARSRLATPKGMNAEECTAQAPTQLAEALKTYGANHIWDCDALNKWKKLPCDCGFAALLRPQGPG